MTSLVKKEKREKRKEIEKKIERIRAGPGTTVFRPIRGKYRTNPDLRHETEQYFTGELAGKDLENEPHFQLSPITVTKEKYFVPIKEGVDTRKDSGSRSFGKLTPQPVGDSPIFDTINKTDLLKKRRSPPTSPKNYPGKEGTGTKAATVAQIQRLNIEKTKSKYYGGKKRRKTRKRKRCRKRKTKRKKKRRKRKRKTRKRVL